MFRSTEPIVWEATLCLIWSFSVEPQAFSSKNNFSRVEYAAASSDDIDRAVGRLRALDANDTGKIPPLSRGAPELYAELFRRVSRWRIYEEGSRGVKR